MSVMPSSTVVGVFRNRSAAELAMKALCDAGFKREQMRCLVAENVGGFFEDLKSLFTGVSPETHDLTSNLTALGLSGEEAQYFSDEYAQGSTILAVKTQGDEEMALNILYQYGAHNARKEATLTAGAASASQQASSTWQGISTAPAYPHDGQSHFDEQETPNDTAQYFTQDHQQNEATANSTIEPLQPPPPGYNLAAYSMQISSGDQAEPAAEEVASNPTTPFPEEAVNDPTTPFPEEVASNQSAPFPADVASDPTTPFPEEVASNPTTPFPEEVTSDPTAPFPEEVSGPLNDQVGEDVLIVEEIDEVETPMRRDDLAAGETPPQSSEVQTPQAADVSPEQASAAQAPQDDIDESENELQQLLAQVETTRQQLQEARARLEVAKKRESQLTTTRLQLKELQAELQATLAELQETQQRMAG